MTPWTAAHQASLSMEFPRQQYWSGLPFPSAGDLPDPGIEPRSPALQADALPSEPPGKPWVEVRLTPLAPPLYWAGECLTLQGQTGTIIAYSNQ